jgi:hypothetical protein
MAALTQFQRASLFEALRAFWSGEDAAVTNGFGIVLTVSQLDTLKNLINSKIDAIVADTDTTANDKLVELADEWDEVASCAVELNNASVGSISGITISSDRIKDNIRQRLATYLEVFHMRDAIKIRNAENLGAGNSVMMIR